MENNNFVFDSIDSIIEKKRLARQDVEVCRQILKQAVRGLNEQRTRADRVLSMRDSILKTADEKAEAIIEQAKNRAKEIEAEARKRAEYVVDSAENVQFTRRRCAQIENEAREKCNEIVNEASMELMKIVEDHEEILNGFLDQLSVFKQRLSADRRVVK